MVCGRGGRIAPMVGCQDQKIAGGELVIKRWEPAVEFLQRAGVAFDVIPVAIELVKIYQVDEEQTLVKFVERAQSLGHAVGVVLGLLVLLNAAPQKNVEDLAYAEDGNILRFKLIQQHP